MSDSARALRRALLDLARAEAARLRLLCCIAVPDDPARLGALFATLRGLGGLAVATLELRLLSAEPHPPWLAQARAVAANGEVRLQPGPAPNAVPERYDLLLRLDHDLGFGMDALLYWLAARMALKPFGLRPTFLRCAWSEADRLLHASDVAAPRDLAGETTRRCGDWRFVAAADPPGVQLMVPVPSAVPFAPVIPLLAASLTPAAECCLPHLAAPEGDPPLAARPALHRLFRDSDTVLTRAFLRPLLAEAKSAPSVGPARTLAPAGRYRRTPPLLVDTTALDPGARVVSVHNLGRCTQRYEAPLAVTLHDAWVIGDGTLITADHRIIEDSCWEYFASGTPPQLRVGPDGALRVSTEAERFIPGPALLLRRPYGANWGHFLLDAALTLAWAAEHGLTEGAALIVGADDPPRSREVLARLAPGLPVLERWQHENWHVGSLRYLSPVMATPLFRLPEAIAALRRRLLDGRGAGARRLVFLTRGEEPRRRLSNEDALFALAAAAGFERIDPASLPFAEQVALFADAEAVIGVKGAALAGILFCRPGTPVIVLSPAGWPDTLFWDLAAQVSCPYLEIFGPTETADGPVPDRAFHVPPEALARALRVVFPPPLPEGIGAPMIPAPARPPAPAGGPARDEAAGAFYQEVMRRVHAVLAPRRYLEIGTLHGETLRLSRCPSIAVDPAFQVDADIVGEMPLLMMFPLESDVFFARHDPAALLGGPVDLAFIDGLHHAEVALRDFINIERHAHRGTVVLLHDCVPLDVAMTRREQHGAEAAASCRPGWWTGDVWRLLPVLRRWRPNLEITVFDAPPSGLAVIRGLDPESTVLRDHAARVVAELFAEDDAAGFARHVAPLVARSTDALESLLATPPRPGDPE